MPRYVFHLEGSQLASELPGPDEARLAAVISAGEMLRDVSARFWNGPEWRMQVTDEQGETICEIAILGTMRRK